MGGEPQRIFSETRSLGNWNLLTQNLCVQDFTSPGTYSRVRKMLEKPGRHAASPRSPRPYLLAFTLELTSAGSTT